jgi:cytoskeleton protein RodZ
VTSSETDNHASKVDARPADSEANLKNNGQLKLQLFSETETVTTEGTDQHDVQHGSADFEGSSPRPVDAEAQAVIALEDSTQPSIGTRLRLAREQRGWSREEVANRLKLQIGLIRRLEEDEYNGIAHAVYLRGYLTSYSRLVGIPLELAEQVVEERGQQMPLVSTGTVSRSRYMLDRYSVSATYLILTGLVVGPAVWLATHGGLEQNLARTVLLDAPTAQIESTLIDPVAIGQAELPPQSTSTTMTSRSSQNEPAPIVASMAPFTSMPPVPAPVVEPAVAPEGNSVTLKLKDASWVEVTSGKGEKLEYGLLVAGTQRSYSSESPITVRIGNAEGAEVFIDGKLVDLAPFRRANVAHLKVSAEGTVAVSPRTDS